MSAGRGQRTQSAWLEAWRAARGGKERATQNSPGQCPRCGALTRAYTLGVRAGLRYGRDAV